MPKMLRVRIDDVQWEKLKPYAKYGVISKLFRHSIREFLSQVEEGKKGEKDAVSRRRVKS